MNFPGGLECTISVTKLRRTWTDNFYTLHPTVFNLSCIKICILLGMPSNNRKKQKHCKTKSNLIHRPLFFPGCRHGLITGNLFAYSTAAVWKIGRCVLYTRSLQARVFTQRVRPMWKCVCVRVDMLMCVCFQSRGRVYRWWWCEVEGGQSLPYLTGPGAEGLFDSVVALCYWSLIVWHFFFHPEWTGRAGEME